MIKKILKIKWENVLLFIFIPLATIQFYKANIDYKMLSLFMSILLYGGIYLFTKLTRQEALLELKDNKEQLILNFLLMNMSKFNKKKKRLFKQAIYKRPSLYIKSKF